MKLKVFTSIIAVLSFIAVYSIAVSSETIAMNGFNPASGQTAATQEDVVGIIDKNFPTIIATGQRLSAKYNELNAILSQPTPDRDKIINICREIGELRGILIAARTEIKAWLRDHGLPPDFFFICNPIDAPLHPYADIDDQGIDMPRAFHHPRQKPCPYSGIPGSVR